MKSTVLSLAQLGAGIVLAPERHLASQLAGDGVALGDLVVERRERVATSAELAPIVMDTSHARDGVLDVAGALRDAIVAKSAKKGASEGDVMISRLRPYLRQIAFVHPEALRAFGGRPLALSTEFYVLRSREEGESLAFLVPFLLSPAAQEKLSSAQEGGHHPRVPRESLFGLRVPRQLVETRATTSRDVVQALRDVYRASSRLRALL